MHRSPLPMLKENELIGVFKVYRQEVPLQRQADRVGQDFASQAVIAIENARLLYELRQSLEQQTATSQVLQVISSSSGDLQPRVCNHAGERRPHLRGQFGDLSSGEGDGFRATAMHNAPSAYREARAGFAHPPPNSAFGVRPAQS